MNDNHSNSKAITSHPWRVFGFEATMFCLSLFLGILGGWRLNKLLKIKQITPSPINLWQFLLYFGVGTGLFLLFLYFFKSKRAKRPIFKKIKGGVLRTIFALAIATGLTFFFGLWLPALYCMIVVAFLLFLWFNRSWLFIHNLIFIFAIAGMGSSIGLQIQPNTVALLSLILAVYDYIAVYKTKHMVKMAKEMIKQKAILGFVVPGSPKDFSAKLGQVKPGGKFLVLGGGDVLFPIIFCVSLIPRGFFPVAVVAFFALLGLVASFLIFIRQKKRKPIPALPPIAVFSVLGWLLTLL